MAASSIQAAGPWVKGYVVASTTLPSAMAAGPTTREARRSSQASIVHMEARFTSPFHRMSRKPSLVPWRTPQEAEALANPPADSLNRDRAGVYYVTWRAASAYRGYNPDIQTYINLFAAEDPASRK